METKKKITEVRPDALVQLSKMIEKVGLAYIARVADAQRSHGYPSVDAYVAMLTTKIEMDTLETAWRVVTGAEWNGQELL